MSITNVKVKLVGNDGNAFTILGKVSQEMKRAHVAKEIIDEYMKKAMSGNYDHLLATTMDYVEVE